ncbi:hypothetical protein ACSSV9_09015, partial [Melioribacter sp. OK-6-Me]|uniref:hypothetical protein n=1 Tax=Melioribacter sp. OK-6-Me TaxID=3423433 RepID=UPI003EDAA741
GSNTLTGNIADLPAGLTLLNIGGYNTLTGNIADAPAVVTYLSISGRNTLADYTAGRIWANNFRHLYLRPAAGYGLSSTEVDNLLIDLANVNTFTNEKQIDIAGNNAPRTSASGAAVSTLISKGVTVITNL